MADPSSSFLGLKFSTLLAGFIGGIISLSFLKVLTKFQAAMAVFTGVGAAGYLTPAVQLWLGAGPVGENALAFIIGLCAMNIIPGVVLLSERFRRDPFSFLTRRGD